MLVAGCGTEISTGNPFDPTSPAQSQARAGVSGTISSVTRPEDAPLALADARVTLIGPSVPAEGTLVTGSDGTFAFADLAPGEWRLEVWHASHFQSTDTFELGPGQIREVDLTLIALPVGGEGVAHLTGTAHKSGELVKPAAEQDHSGILVEVEDAGVRTVTNSAGDFDLFLNPGSWNIVFSARNYNITRRNGVEIAADATTTIPDNPVVLDANPGTLSGKATLEGLADGSWADVLVSADGGFTGTTNADGTWRIIEMPAGTYGVSFLKDGFVTSRITGVVVEGGRETVIPDVPLALARGDIIGTVDLVGEDLDGGVTVSLVGTGRAAVSADSGSFLLEGVPVGTYELRATHDGYAGASRAAVTVTQDGVTDVGALSLTRIQGDFLIDGGARYTNDAGGVVTVTLDNAQAISYRLSEDATFGGGSDAFVTYPASGDVSFTLADADGPHTLHVEYQLADSTVSRVFSASITLDRSAPEQLALVIDNGSGYSRDTSGIVTLNLSAADATTGVESVHVSNTALSSAELATASFVTFQSSVLHTLDTPTVDGTKTVYVYVRDLAGNVTDPGTSGSVVLDRTPPTLTSVTLDCGATVDATWCNDTVLDVSITATDADQMALSNDAGIPITIWEPFAPTRRWALKPGEGTRSVYVKLRDLAGNVTTIASDSVSIDTTPPSDLKVVLSGPIADSQTSTTLSASSVVDVAISATDTGGLDQMWLATDDGFSGTTAQTFATAVTGFSLLAGDGVRAVYIRVTDLAGNVSVASGSLEVDTTGPTLSGARFLEAGSTGIVATAQGTLELVASGADQVRVTGDLTNSFAGQWTAMTGRLAVDLDAAADGLKNLTVEARDLAGNVSSPTSVSVPVTLDSTPPTSASVGINGGVTWTLTRDVTLALAATDAATSITGVAVAENALDCATATYEAFSSTRPFTLGTTEGSHTVVACFRDGASLTTTASASITLDTAAPTGVGLTLAGGAGTISNGTGVTADITGSDTLSGPAQLQMRLSEDSTFAGVAWGTFAASDTLNLSGGDGTKTVYLQVKDAAGHIASASDTVTVDTTAPVGGALLLTPTDVTAVTSVVANLSAGGATEMCFEGDVVGASTDGCTTGWIAFNTSRALTLTAGDGEKTVTVTYRDAGGLESLPVSDKVTLDTTAPTGTSVTIDAGGAYATTTDVILTLKATDATTAVAELAVADGSLDCATATYGAYTVNLPWALPSPDGSKSVVACFRDAAGNTATASATMVLDTAAPTGVGLTLDGGAVWATSTGVSAAATGTDNLTSAGNLQMRLSEDPNFTGVAWTTLASPTPITLSSGDGTKTVYLQVRDEAGQTSSASDTIRLDTVAPESPRFDLRPDGYATAAAITAELGAVGATEVCFTGPVTGASTDSCNVNGWQAYATSLALTLTGGDGLKTVNVLFRDAAGLTTASLSDQVTLDTTAPNTTAASITVIGVIADGVTSTSLTGTRDVTLSVSGISDATSPLTEMKVSENAALTGATWEPYQTTHPVRLTSADGTVTVYVKVRDAAGKESAIVSGSIALDTTAPRPATVLVGGGATYITSPATAIDFWIGGAAVSWSTDPASGFTACATNPCASASPGETVNQSLPGIDGTHRVSLFFRDAAGNVSQGFDDEVILDATPPSAIDVRSVAPRTTTAFVDLSDSTDATSGVAGYEVRAVDVRTGDTFTDTFSVSEGWLTGLPALRTYNVSARAMDLAGLASTWSATKSAFVGLRSSQAAGPLVASVKGDRVFSYRGLIYFPQLKNNGPRLVWCDVRERGCAESGLTAEIGGATTAQDLTMTATGDQLWTFILNSSNQLQGYYRIGSPDAPGTVTGWPSVNIGAGGQTLRSLFTDLDPTDYRSLNAAASGRAMITAWVQDTGSPSWARTIRYAMCNVSDDCTKSTSWSGPTDLFTNDPTLQMSGNYHDLSLDVGENHLWMSYSHYFSGGDVLLWGCTLSSGCANPANWYQVPLLGAASIHGNTKVLEVDGVLYVAAYVSNAPTPEENGMRIWRCPVTSANTPVCTTEADFTFGTAMTVYGQQPAKIGQYTTIFPRVQFDVGGGYLYTTAVDYWVDELYLGRCPVSADCSSTANWSVATLTTEASQVGSPLLSIVAGNPVVALGTSDTRVRIFEPATWAPMARSILPNEEVGDGLWSNWSPRDGTTVDGYRIRHDVSPTPPFGSLDTLSDPATGIAAISTGSAERYGNVVSYQGLDESIAEPTFTSHLGASLSLAGSRYARLYRTSACRVVVGQNSTGVRIDTCPTTKSCLTYSDWDRTNNAYQPGCCGKEPRHAEAVVGTDRINLFIAKGEGDAPRDLLLRQIPMDPVTCQISDFVPGSDVEVKLLDQTVEVGIRPAHLTPMMLGTKILLGVTTTWNDIFGTNGWRLLSCDTTTGCDALGEWTSVTLGDAYAGGRFVSDGTYLWWLAHLPDASWTNNNSTLLRCDLSTGCDAAADWPMADRRMIESRPIATSLTPPPRTSSLTLGAGGPSGTRMVMTLDDEVRWCDQGAACLEPFNWNRGRFSPSVLGPLDLEGALAGPAGDDLIFVGLGNLAHTMGRCTSRCWDMDRWEGGYLSKGTSDSVTLLPHNNLYTNAGSFTHGTIGEIHPDGSVDYVFTYQHPQNGGRYTLANMDAFFDATW